jgi:hypothetical protein
MNFLNELLEAQYPGKQLRVTPDPKGKVEFRVQYRQGGANAGIVTVYVVAEIFAWKSWPQMYRVQSRRIDPKAPDEATRTARVVMYTMLFEDLCAQHGVKTKNLRRKEMKKWQQASPTEP